MEFATNDKPVNLFDAVAEYRRKLAAEEAMTILDKGQHEALRCLRIFTNGTYSIASMAGARNLQARRIVLGNLRGSRPPAKEAGVNAMREAFYELAGINTSAMTYRAAELAFDAWAHDHGDHLDIAEGA